MNCYSKYDIKKLVYQSLKHYSVPFVDNCDPSYTGDCGTCGGGNPLAPYSAWITTTENASVNDWSPTGFATAGVIVRTGTGAINITGLDATGAVQGTERQIHNRGTGVATLTNDDVASVVTNRIKTPASAATAISINGVATLIYNGTNWFVKLVNPLQATTGISIHGTYSSNLEAIQAGAIVNTSYYVAGPLHESSPEGVLLKVL